MKRLLYLLISVLLPSASIYSQMLFSENMTMYIDSTKTIQGMISPVMEFKTEKENVFTLKNIANFNLLIGRKRVINVINKFELSTYGDKITVSGGYIHGEFRYLLHHSFEVYPYIESQWAESRGMLYKVSSGLQARYRLVNSKSCLMFANGALFFEYEKWKHPVPDSITGNYAISRNIKSHLSLSFRHRPNDHWEFIATAIHQANPDSYLTKARFGGAIDLKYRITQTTGIRIAYRFIYDTDPIVDIRKYYNTLETAIDVAF